MSCFCLANLHLLPRLSIDASVNLSASARAALDLYADISLGLPDLGPPPFALPQLDLSASALASAAAMAQLRAQASASLGIDITSSLGITALARLTATLSARMSAITSLNINMDAWIQLARLNAVCLDLTAIFDACQSASASAAFNVVVAPPAWGGAMLPSLSALASLSAQLDVALDADFMASLQASANALARATASISLDASSAVSLLAGFSAVAQLSASLGINPLQAGLPAVRARVVANFSAMAAAAARLGINLSLGSAGVPEIPGLRAALTASLTAQLQAAASAAASLGASLDASGGVSFDLSASLSMDVLLAVSLCVSLSLALGIDVALPAPCGGCDLRAIMAALDAPPVPSLDAPAVPSLPDGVPSPVAGAPAMADTSDATVGESASASTAGGSTGGGSSDASGGGGGGSGGGGGGGGGSSGGGGGGGGVQATVMTAQLMCSFGAAPSPLTVLPVNRTTVGSQVAANIMDYAPMVNIMPFGLCSAPTNPVVIAATAAKLGVFTPMPCIPATAAPWVAGAPTVLLGNMPMLDSKSKCMCTWAGVISITFPGQVTTSIP